MYQLPEVFVCRYVNQLSPNAYCVLIRLFKFYLENEREHEIIVSYSRFEKEVLFDNDEEQAKNIWAELSFWELVKRVYKENTYELNITKIRRDNNDFLQIKDEIKKKKFYIRLLGKKIKKEKQIIKPQIVDFVNKFIVSYSKQNQERIRQTVSGITEYYLRKYKTVKVNDISWFLLSLLEEEEKIIGRAFEIFNNCEMFGKVHPNYLKGIISNLKQETKNTDESEISIKKKQNLEDFEKRKEISNRKFAIKIASGKIEENISYQAFLKLKDFVRLNEMYNLGVEILKSQKRDSEIFKGYEWLNDKTKTK